MHIESFQLHFVHPFEDIVTFVCDERVNLFVGPNASGKSTILGVMEYVYSPRPDHPYSGIKFPSVSWKHDWASDDIEHELYFESGVSFCWMQASEDWLRTSPKPIDGAKAYLEPIWNRVPIFSVPAIRAGMAHKSTKVYEEGSTSSLTFGIDHFADPVMFNGQYVKWDIDRIRSRDSFNPRRLDKLDRALDVGYSCARNICSEVVRDSGLHSYIDAEDGSAIYPNMGIGTLDFREGRPLYLGDLSSGTQGTLLWIWGLVLKMASHYDWEEGWQNRPAVLLVDEIENHLHPTWQRRVIPELLKQFPNLQIFATTHSPFVVAGLKAGQVHLVKRGHNGFAIIETNTEDVVGWTMDEVLRTLMGVDDPTDEETARAASELRRLRNEGPKSDEAEEQRRQDRIRELRQRVNRDLLAGGPMAAQREAFEHRFAEALQNHQKYRSLDQASG